MTDKKILEELKRLKGEIAELKEQGKRNKIRRKIFSKTSVVIGIILTFLFSSIIVYAATITKPNTFTDNTVISAGQVNSDFDLLYTESNSQDSRITTVEGKATSLETRTTALESRATSAESRITTLEGKVSHVNVRYLICYSGIYPTIDGGMGEDAAIGEIRMFAGTFAPGGWMFCEGQTLPIPSYAALYSIIGTTYGGNGSTTFCLPNLTGKIVTHGTGM